MKKEDKEAIVNSLSEKLSSNRNFYIADASGLTVGDTNKLRRLCFAKGVKMQVVKNTLIAKAMEKAEIKADDFTPALKGSSSLLFADNFKAPAQLLKEFRATKEKPVLKAAFIDESLYLGDNIDVLLKLKSKEEMIGEIIGLLQSPIRNVLSGLQSGGGKIAGILKTLSEKPE